MDRCKTDLVMKLSLLQGEVPAVLGPGVPGHHRGAVQLRGHHPQRRRVRAGRRGLQGLARQAEIRLR